MESMCAVSVESAGNIDWIGDHGWRRMIPTRNNVVG